MSEEQKRLIDVPAEILAANVVSSMIKARGVINLWDAMILRLIVDMRKEAADDLALATSALTAQEPYGYVLNGSFYKTDPREVHDTGLSAVAVYTREDVK